MGEDGKGKEEWRRGWRKGGGVLQDVNKSEEEKGEDGGRGSEGHCKCREQGAGHSCSVVVKPLPSSSNSLLVTQVDGLVQAQCPPLPMNSVLYPLYAKPWPLPPKLCTLNPALHTLHPANIHNYPSCCRWDWRQMKGTKG